MAFPAQADIPPTTASFPASSPGIGRQMAKGTGWMVGARLAVQGIGTISTLILARLLTPADFGLVALATAVSAALMAISEFSFDVVLIQNQSATRAHYDTVWTLSILRNAILALCLVLSSGTSAALLGDARLEPIIYWLALSTFMDGFQNVGIVDFRKGLRFHKDLIFTVLGKLGSFAVTVPLAFLWRDYWALVAGMVMGAFVNLVLSFLMHPFRPRVSFGHWREIMHFSKWLVINNICAFVAGRCPTFIVGPIVGPQGLGIYNIAGEIANLVSSNLLAPLRRALFPGYAQASGSPDSLRQSFLDVLGLVALIGAPLTFGIGLVADPLVKLLLGKQWFAAIPLIQVFSIGAFLWVTTAASGPVFFAKGKPSYVTWLQAVDVLFLVPLLILGTRHAGALGAAWAGTAAAGLFVTAELFLAARLLDLQPNDLISLYLRPFFATALMALAVKQLHVGLSAPDTSLGLTYILTVEIGAGACVYSAVIIALWLLSGRPGGAERHTLEGLKWAINLMLRRA